MMRLKRHAGLGLRGLHTALGYGGTARGLGVGLGLSLALLSQAAQAQSRDRSVQIEQSPITDLDTTTSQPPPPRRDPIEVDPRPVRYRERERDPVRMGADAPSAHYFEATMGFVAGGRNHSDMTFESQNNVAPSLTEPFLNLPYSGTNIFGLRYDLRLILSYVRMTVGMDFPFTNFRTADTKATYTVDGMTRTVTVQSLRPYELRFGLGGELPVSYFAPFVDVLGTVHFVNTTLSVDDNNAEFKATGFGFSARAGCRIQAKPWFFVQLAGEVGIIGPTRWNADLSVGFSAGSHR
jgi:hypothetical protein